MYRIAAILVVLSMAAALVVPGTAEAASKKKKRAYYPSSSGQGYYAPRNETYQEFIADKRPFGSASWWQQMDREGRGGQARAN
jgi:hypothetical protein